MPSRSKPSTSSSTSNTTRRQAKPRKSSNTEQNKAADVNGLHHLVKAAQLPYGGHRMELDEEDQDDDEEFDYDNDSERSPSAGLEDLRTSKEASPIPTEFIARRSTITSSSSDPFTNYTRNMLGPVDNTTTPTFPTPHQTYSALLALSNSSNELQNSSALLSSSMGFSSVNSSYNGVSGLISNGEASPDYNNEFALIRSPSPLSSTFPSTSSMMGTSDFTLDSLGFSFDPSLLFNAAFDPGALTSSGAPTVSSSFRIPRSPALPPHSLSRIQIDHELLSQTNISPTSLSLLTDHNYPTISSSSSASSSASNLFIPDLAVNDVPKLPSEFYLHLISCFFTYFHPCLPVLEERIFFEDLIPENNHHPMLLCAIYSIGALYSRHPLVYKAPLYSPQRANEYFANKGALALPSSSSEGKSGRGFEQLEVCQASLILSFSEYGNRIGQRQWMFTGMGCRLAQRLDIPFEETTDDFFSFFNGRTKPAISCTKAERKRTWWACVIIDFYNSLTTGTTFLINEGEYIATLLDTESLLVHEVGAANSNPLGSRTASLLSLEDPTAAEKWKEALSGYPSPTAFGDNDTCRFLARLSPGKFQIDHLFSDPSETLFFVQLNFLIRTIMRHNASRSSNARNPTSSSAAYLLSLISSTPDTARLHDTMVAWYEKLPVPFRLFNGLDAFTGRTSDLDIKCLVPASERLSPICVATNLLYYGGLALLHQRRAIGTNNIGGSSAGTFRLSTSVVSRGLYSSQQICAIAYKAQCFILRRVYRTNGVPLSADSPTPAELVATPMMHSFLMPTVVTVLSCPQYATYIVRDESEAFSTGSGGGMDLEPAAGVLLPAMENMAKIWVRAGVYANNLRGLLNIARSRLAWNSGAVEPYARQSRMNEPMSASDHVQSHNLTTVAQPGPSVNADQNGMAAAAAAAVAAGAIAAAQATMEAIEALRVQANGRRELQANPNEIAHTRAPSSIPAPPITTVTAGSLWDGDTGGHFGGGGGGVIL
ncbi:fungal-specific transcription factor domain-containing protein [Cladochytrium replicatum]|nr:fungal-specific transcription factor domain-containing protein [Cladochytrium replicatum]